MNSAQVSIEVPLENTVHEITYEGVEIIQPPLSMSENLTRLAQRIDFSSTADDDDLKIQNKKDSSELVGHQNNECTFRTLPAWPWESVRNKLRSGLTELSVLGDILQISSQKKYMVLDPVQGDVSDIRPAVSVLYKKRALSAASAVLLSGAERIKTCLTEAKSRSSYSSIPDFHLELLRLRQNWRLRKIGNAILGDLSYKTAGSRFNQTGVFEVSQAEQDNDSDPSEETGTAKLTSALRVTVPQELQGIAYIQVVIQDEKDTLSVASIGVLGSAPTPAEIRWQQRLEAAQNVLFCRELFAVLAREAVQITTFPIPPQACGNKITCTLFPGTQLIICLCHGSTGKNSNTMPKLDQNHVLEHSLHQLLRDIHRQNSAIPVPHPASSQVGVSKKRRLAGPLAYDKSLLMAMSSKIGILEEIISQAQHVVLRLRTMSVLDDLAKEIKDPFVIAHWASLNAARRSSVRINLLSAGYDMTARTPLVVHVKEKSLKCILKDGKAINLSYEGQELRDLILSQIAVHQVMALLSLSKCLNWHVLASSSHLGCHCCHILGNAAGCLLSSPNGKRTLAIRSSPQRDQSHVEVFVGSQLKSSEHNKQGAPEELNTFSQSALHLFLGNKDETKSSSISTNGMIYKAVQLDRLEGKNFVNKMEMLMAVLSDGV